MLPPKISFKVLAKAPMLMNAASLNAFTVSRNRQTRQPYRAPSFEASGSKNSRETDPDKPLEPCNYCDGDNWNKQCKITKPERPPFRTSAFANTLTVYADKDFLNDYKEQAN
jgi:hypothetical protein